jgi:hypothetical protein
MWSNNKTKKDLRYDCNKAGGTLQVPQISSKINRPVGSSSRFESGRPAKTLNHMKKIITYILLVGLLIVYVLLAPGCATTKKDCRGVKHYKQSGGFYL